MVVPVPCFNMSWKSLLKKACLHVNELAWQYAFKFVMNNLKITGRNKWHFLDFCCHGVLWDG